MCFVYKITHCVFTWSSLKICGCQFYVASHPQSSPVHNSLSTVFNICLSFHLIHEVNIRETKHVSVKGIYEWMRHRNELYCKCHIFWIFVDGYYLNQSCCLNQSYTPTHCPNNYIHNENVWKWWTCSWALFNSSGTWQDTNYIYRTVSAFGHIYCTCTILYTSLSLLPSHSMEMSVSLCARHINHGTFGCSGKLIDWIFCPTRLAKYYFEFFLWLKKNKFGISQIHAAWLCAFHFTVFHSCKCSFLRATYRFKRLTYRVGKALDLTTPEVCTARERASSLGCIDKLLLH